MTAWRKLLLVAGVVGGIAMFLPLFELRQGPVGLSVSAYQLSFGLDRTHKLLDRDLPAVLERRLPVMLRGARDDARLVVEGAKGAVLMFVPSLLMIALAIAGFTRRRFGRTLGAAALLCSLLSIGSFIALRAGLIYGLDETGLTYVATTFELGAQLLLFTGIAGAIAAIGALVKPELAPTRSAR